MALVALVLPMFGCGQCGIAVMGDVTQTQNGGGEGVILAVGVVLVILFTISLVALASIFGGGGDRGGDGPGWGLDIGL